MEKIKQQLEEAGFQYAVAVATSEEVKAGAACGQLSVLIEQENMNMKIKKITIE